MAEKNYGDMVKIIFGWMHLLTFKKSCRIMSGFNVALLADMEICPVGNKPGELFCTKDVIITQKSDLFFYTEDEAERSKRSHDCTDICEKYQEQTSEHYTYNDYLCYFE